MSYNLLSDLTPVARKAHLCIWCGERIPSGTRYRHERSIYDGNFQNHKWHLECDDASAEHFRSQYDFDPYENERPKPLAPPKTRPMTDDGYTYTLSCPCGEFSRTDNDGSVYCPKCEQRKPCRIAWNEWVRSTDHFKRVVAAIKSACASDSATAEKD